MSHHVYKQTYYLALCLTVRRGLHLITLETIAILFHTFKIRHKNQKDSILVWKLKLLFVFFLTYFDG